MLHSLLIGLVCKFDNHSYMLFLRYLQWETPELHSITVMTLQNYFYVNNSKHFDLFLYAVASAPITARPVQESKTKSKTAVQPAVLPVTKAIVLASFQHTFAYLTRAAVRST